MPKDKSYKIRKGPDKVPWRYHDWEEKEDKAGGKRSARSMAKPKPKAKPTIKKKVNDLAKRSRTTKGRATPSSVGIHKTTAKPAPKKRSVPTGRGRSRTTMPAPRARRWTPAGARAHKSRGGKK